jgi:antitoxin component YwqK of YwqJK toxin-antitoxin module
MKLNVYYLSLILSSIILLSFCQLFRAGTWKYTYHDGTVKTGTFKDENDLENQTHLSRKGTLDVAYDDGRRRVEIREVKEGGSFENIKVFAADGSLSGEYNKLNSRLHGYYLNISNGQLMEEGTFNHGNKDGKWKEYDSYSRKVVLNTYRQGAPWEGSFDEFRDSSYYHLVYESGKKVLEERFDIKSVVPKQ